jgi:hypothetical protein
MFSRHGLARNLSYPFPQQKDKVALASSTGLSVRQVETWFSRTRQRKLTRADISGLISKTLEDPAQKVLPNEDDEVVKVNQVTRSGMAYLRNQKLDGVSYIQERTDIAKDPGGTWHMLGERRLWRLLSCNETKPRTWITRRSFSCPSVIETERTVPVQTLYHPRPSSDRVRAAFMEMRQMSLEVDPGSPRGCLVDAISDNQDWTAWHEVMKFNSPCAEKYVHGLESWGIEQWLGSLPE